MKRILCLLLALLLVCGLCACGKDAPKDNKPDKGGNSTAATTTTTEAAGESTTTPTEGEDTTTSATEGATTTKGDTTTAHPIDNTTATKKPTATTTGGEDEGMSIRILAIGDGFAVDAMEKYLYDIFKSAGYTVLAAEPGGKEAWEMEYSFPLAGRGPYHSGEDQKRRVY